MSEVAPDERLTERVTALEEDRDAHRAELGLFHDFRTELRLILRIASAVAVLVAGAFGGAAFATRDSVRDSAAKIATVDVRLGALEGRVGQVVAERSEERERLARLETAVAGMSDRLARVETAVTNMSERLERSLTLNARSPR